MWAAIVGSHQIVDDDADTSTSKGAAFSSAAAAAAGAPAATASSAAPANGVEEEAKEEDLPSPSGRLTHACSVWFFWRFWAGCMSGSMPSA